MSVGDKPGHPFHGNQWTGGIGGEALAALDSAPLEKAGAKAWVKAHQALYANNPEFRAVTDLIMLHTQGDYQITNAFTIRDNMGELPERFKDSALPGWVDQAYFGNPMARYRNPLWPGNDLSTHVEGRLTWSKAAALLNSAVENAKPLDVEIHRGMHGRYAYEAFAGLKPGQTLDMPGVSSFTADKMMAEDFANGEARGQRSRRGRNDVEPYVVVLSVEPGARGIRAQALSPWKQSEVITSGKFQVMSVEDNEGGTYGRGGGGYGRQRVLRVRLKQIKAGRIG